ncbi:MULTISPECIES: exodeoxyribonuclease V subunit alpha [unclassified Vibrio]|uniref:RecBCD enzyme subunit RecD n=1 Tax=Vibrio sp. HB236076 TaxID=3232307 RepID=A0AB39HGD2_9VIBR|nr:exodeoxyribonuclease V subunit alpha [Vibrio sp. HB161653]MDP5254905.1 exodeoxyribonuclease V subunit alpha [Vibrio sp. HB161653]
MKACYQEYLTYWVERGHLRPLDAQLAEFMARYCQGESLPLLAALTSAEVGKGHLCLALPRQGQATRAWLSALGWYGPSLQEAQAWLDNNDWQQELMASPWVAKQEEAVPLVLESGRLYLHRYWFYQRELADWLLSRSVPLATPDLAAKSLDRLFARDYSRLWQAWLREGMGLAKVERQQWLCDQLDIVAPESLDWGAIFRLFENAHHSEALLALDNHIPLSQCLNWQKVAAGVALTRRFSVISGGPGTGKTTTVTKILAALLQSAQATGQPLPLIKLVAPTGKAATRLSESIGQAVGLLAVEPEIKAAIPTVASTLHRLLGSIPNQVEFRHHQGNRLHLDVLVVDEASMVDLTLMYKLVSALPDQAQLILLGDKDQLASVEAGAILGDICHFIEQGYSEAQAQRLTRLTGFPLSQHHPSQARAGIADSLCMLQKSYRFDARSGIGQLAKAVNGGDKARVHQVLETGYRDIRFYPLSSEHYSQCVREVAEGYQHYCRLIQEPPTEQTWKATVKQALSAFNQYRLLCALREGDFGVSGFNQRIERRLRSQSWLPRSDELWYHGRPIMITRNDYSLELYNGDIGLCLWDYDHTESLRLKVYFQSPDGEIKSVLPSRVPSHDSAFAMTVHKSQGSEFSHTWMVLPPKNAPVLTRELVYTGITRAKQTLTMYGHLDVLTEAIGSKTHRESGLVEKLARPTQGVGR